MGARPLLVEPILDPRAIAVPVGLVAIVEDEGLIRGRLRSRRGGSRYTSNDMGTNAMLAEVTHALMAERWRCAGGSRDRRTARRLR